MTTVLIVSVNHDANSSLTKSITKETVLVYHILHTPFNSNWNFQAILELILN